MEKAPLAGDSFYKQEILFLIIQACGLVKTGVEVYNFKDMPKRTFQPHTRHRAKTHGFRARIASKAGRNVLKRRRLKGRAKIAL